MTDSLPMPASPDPAADAPTRWLFNARSDFLEAWHRALARAVERGCRELLLCDADYAIGRSANVPRWSNCPPGCSRTAGWVVLAAQFDTVQRQHPRWVNWRRQWSHVVQCRQVDEADVAAIPSMVLAPGEISLRLRDPVRYRGRLSFERADAVRDADDLDAFLQRSHEAFPVTNLGL